MQWLELFLNNFVAYYDSLEEGDANTLRTKEFLTNHSYDDINEMISKRTGMNKSHLNVDNSYEVSTSNKQKNPAYNDTLWFLDMLKSMGE